MLQTRASRGAPIDPGFVVSSPILKLVAGFRLLHPPDAGTTRDLCNQAHLSSNWPCLFYDMPVAKTLIEDYYIFEVFSNFYKFNLYIILIA
jgi:hypothetical protein